MVVFTMPGESGLVDTDSVDAKARKGRAFVVELVEAAKATRFGAGEVGRVRSARVGLDG